MRGYSGGTTREGCLQCHGRQSTHSTTGVANDLGTVGGLCLARCHTGTGILGAVGEVIPEPAPTVNPANYAGTAAQTPQYNTVYFSGSHGRIAANLRVGGWSGAAAVSWPPAGANTWPYMAAAVANIECTSCHAVHDNQNAPFLWAPLGPTVAFPGGASTFDGFCDRCHSEASRSGNSIGIAPNGNHPINFILDNSAASTRATNGRRGRRIVVQDYNAQNVFDVPNPAPNTMINAANPWNLGGHIVVPGTSAVQNTTAIPAVPASGVTTAALGCYTCHSAHRTSVNGENNLVNVVTTDNTGTWNPLCVGCHGSVTTQAGDSDDWRVGSLTAFGHPAGTNATRDANNLYTTTIGGFKFAVNTGVTYTNRQLSVGWGTNNALLCTTCHQVHGGRAASMALANITTGTIAICRGCHNGIGIPNAPDATKGGNLGDATTNRANNRNMHHVTSTTGVVSNGMGKTANTSTILAINTTPSWRNPTTLLGDLATGMDCADCHTFNGTAHNW
jgi:predicted CXXCH cytochrome family protein